ncbi:MAG: type III-A CRISPR-associated RAMP protein Csm3 [bacterium]|nr:type III-A CRISPR-associated RAMP protein Csm3 [bacterium]
MGLKLKGILKLKYKLTVLTGLHIGGSKENIEIGGIDNIVIKIPVLIFENNEIKYNVPYIPGSSLKGKIRALLEYIEKPINNPGKPIAFVYDGNPCECGECNICKLFGPHKSKSLKDPIRLRFSDFYPTLDSINLWEEALDGLYTEIKTENIINRIKGTAEHPRHIERVIPFSEFQGTITFRIFENDKFELYQILEKGINLLNDDYLGGNGSRGYGKVKLELLFNYSEYKPIDNYPYSTKMIKNLDDIKSIFAN